jgi:ATP-dependent DNA helicase RecQ
MSLAALEPMVDLSRSRLEAMLKVLDVDGAVRRVSGGWESTGQPWTYDAERYERVAAEREREQRAMLDYIDTTDCRMEFLRRQLDDPEAAPCGRCDNCTGPSWSSDVPSQAAGAARDRLARPGVEVEPRRMWPSGLSQVSGKIGPALVASQGRALGRLTDIGWGTIVRDLLAAQDQPVPDNVFDALVKVLASWGWEQRPVAVVSIPSRSKPELVASLAERIAAIGKLPYLGALDYVDPPAERRHNSAQRVRSLWTTFTVPFDIPAGPVLLVDDRIESGWTMTIAAKLLREAGATAVLPLTLAVTTG